MTLAPHLPHAAFEHRALFHEGLDELVASLAPEVSAGLADGARVLVCLDAPAQRALSSAVEGSDAVTFLSNDVRYARPATAMGALNEFVSGAIAAGAPAVWSVGAIGFDGSVDDQQWHRYEAAVNDVLADLPLRAVCTYDTSALPAAVLAAARTTHPTVADDGARRASEHFRSGPTLDPQAALHLAALVRRCGDPLFDDEVTTSSAVRDRLRQLLGPDLAPARLADLHLVASELATNAFRHGRPPVRCAVWSDDAHVIVRVEDRGIGLADPYAELRPPRGRIGGWGMWLVGQLSERIAVERIGDRTVVTAALAR